MMEELDFDDEVLSIHPDEDIKKIESIEIDANSNLEQPTDSDSGEIDDDEETNDLEEGEIKDSNPISKKKSDIACRFFKRGSCAFGSQCQYLHVSDTVYKMFDTNTQRRNDIQHVEHHNFPKPIIFSPNVLPPRPFIEPPISVAPKANFYRQCNTVEDNWEKGLEQARILIQKANLKKKNEDGEPKKFDSKNKDGKVKGQNFSKTNLGNELDFASKKYSEKALINKNLRKEDTIDEKKSNYRYQPRSNDKWIDPWRRSKSPLTRKRLRSLSGSPSRSRKHSYASSISSSSSSSSEIDDIYRRPYKKKSPKGQPRFVSRSRSVSQSRPPKKPKISPRHSFNGKRNSRSNSRSISRSPYEKGTFSSCTRSRSSSLSSCSDCPKSFTAEDNDMKRISAKLSEQLYRKSPPRASPVPDSDCETSEMTVSSASCTPVSSDCETESPHDSPSLRIKKEPDGNNTSFYSNKTKSFTNAKVFNRNHSNLLKNQDMMQHKEGPPSFYRKTQSCNNNDKRFNNWNFKAESTPLRPKSTGSYFSSVKKPVSAPEFSKNKMSDDVELLYTYQGMKNPNRSSSNVPKLTPNTPSLKSNKIEDVMIVQESKCKSEPSGYVSKIGNVRKQNIVLNLQPKSKYCFKPEITNKQLEVNEASAINKKETAASKREQLLNKLRLIDDAIARKKSTNTF